MQPQATPLGSKPLEVKPGEGEAPGEKRVPAQIKDSPWLWGLESIAVSIPSVSPEDTPSSTRPSQAPQAN